MAANGSSLDLGESFYGDQDFDLEDFDKEGFSGLDDSSSDMPYEEDKY